MQSILTEEILKSDYLEQYVFDYIEENDNIILDRNVLVVLDYLGYKWKWVEEKQKISNIKKGKCSNVFISKIENTLEETMDIETEATHTYKVNGLISHNTVNLPQTTTEEEISEIYLKAHDMGIIGVSVYREGSREGILVHNIEDNKEGIVKTNAPKRPKKLPCHVYRSTILNRVTNESEKWIIFIGLLNDEPYELMAGKITDVDFDSSITEGEINKTKKDGKKVYQFMYNGEVLVEDLNSAFLNELRAYVTRLISWGLRHGAGLEYLKEVLQKSGTIVDFNNAISRSISKYVKETNSKERCPTCGAELKYIESCVKCSDPTCSFTKCG